MCDGRSHTVTQEHVRNISSYPNTQLLQSFDYYKHIN